MVKSSRFSAALSAAAFALAVAAGCQTAPQPVGAPNDSPSAATPAPTPTPTATATTAPSTTSTPGTTQALRLGDRGTAVLALQQRLQELGYWLPEPDGVYGASTAHAVTAFQKAARLTRDGVAGPATLTKLAEASRIAPRSTSGSLIEVDIERQLLLIVVNGQLQWALDTSTGRVAGTTPRGTHHIYRQIDGYHQAPLGVLYRPKYIFEGVAIHGFPSVPAYPASHGCLRVTNSAMDWLWSSGAAPVGTRVWVY